METKESDKWLNDCVIEDIHTHALDTDILIKIYEFPIFRLSDFYHSPHEPHEEKGLSNYSRRERVLAKFISHDEVKKSGITLGQINFSLGSPNIEAVNCNGVIMQVIKGGEAGGNSVIVNIGIISSPIYVFAIDRNKRKLQAGDWVLFNKIHQIVVKNIVTDHKLLDSRASHKEFFYAFKCSNCGLEGTTKKNKSKESFYHRVYFTKSDKSIIHELTDSADLRASTPLYANHIVCPNCNTKNLHWKLNKSEWRR